MGDMKTHAKWLTRRAAAIGSLLALSTLMTLPACDSRSDDKKDDSGDEDGDKKEKKKKKDDKKKAKSISSRIDDFKRTKIEPEEKEAYDHQLLTNQAKQAGIDTPGVAKELPPTLTDVMLYDFRMIGHRDMELGVIDKSVSEETILKIIGFYASTPPEKIRGYRPYTHKEFIDGLSEDERKQLAKELKAHLDKNGFLGPEYAA